MEVREAKQKELENWSKFEVYEEVQDCGQPFLSVHWVCTEKSVDGHKRIKARLVASGFEEISSEKVRVDSPTGSKEVLRILTLNGMGFKNLPSMGGGFHPPF